MVLLSWVKFVKPYQFNPNSVFNIWPIDLKRKKSTFQWFRCQFSVHNILKVMARIVTVGPELKSHFWVFLLLITLRHSWRIKTPYPWLLSHWLHLGVSDVCTRFTCIMAWFEQKVYCFRFCCYSRFTTVFLLLFNVNCSYYSRFLQFGFCWTECVAVAR